MQVAENYLFRRRKPSSSYLFKLLRYLGTSYLHSSLKNVTRNLWRKIFCDQDRCYNPQPHKCDASVGKKGHKSRNILYCCLQPPTQASSVPICTWVCHLPCLQSRVQGFSLFHISGNVYPSLPSFGPKSSENVNKRKSLQPFCPNLFGLFFSKIFNYFEIIKTNFPSQSQTNLYKIFRKSSMISGIALCTNELSNIKTGNEINFQRRGWTKYLWKIWEFTET
jgi:hypothetical protein